MGRRRGTGIDGRIAVAYAVVQAVGGIAGAILANAMFDRQVFEIATKDRLTAGHLLGEVVATAGLIALIFALARTGRAGAVRCCGRCVYRRGVLVHQLNKCSLTPP